MLKYIIIFHLMYFCNSVPISLVGNFRQLIFIQRSPITAFYGTNTSNMVDYVSQHWKIFRTNKWIIDGLLTFKFNNTQLTHCKDYFGRSLIYKPEKLSQNLRKKLHSKWPALQENQTEDDLWGYHYNTSGSCISTTTSGYFENAVELLDNRNIGQILEKHGITPGGNYTLNHIITSISTELLSRPYVRCLQPQNPWWQEQYLLEVQICFNRGYQLIDCNYYATDLCEINKYVIYPGWPRIL